MIIVDILVLIGLIIILLLFFIFPVLAFIGFLIEHYDEISWNYKKRPPGINRGVFRSTGN